MRIGIDARVLCGRNTGDRTYWSNLIRGLLAIDSENEYRLYVRTALPDVEAGAVIGDAKNAKIVVAAAGSDRLWSLATFPAAARRDGVDIAHVQYTVPPRMPCPTITTVHDITFRLFPKLFTLKDRMLLNASLPGSLRRAARVLAVSESTRQDLLRAFGWLAPDKVVTTLLATSPGYRPLGPEELDAARRMLAQTYGIDGPYALSVGVLQPRKNLPLLLRAFRAAMPSLASGHPSPPLCLADSAPLLKGEAREGLSSESAAVTRNRYKLVVVGKKGWLADETNAAIEAAGDCVVFTGYVPDEHLPALYGMADLFCYPSLYEGFGLPPLEAMACGCPVLASNTSSLPEVVGDAGVLLPPDREEAWTGAIRDVLSDPERRARMREKGLARAARFSWERAARLTLDVYNQARLK